MTVNVIFKIAAVGILISVLNQILKHSGRDDQAFLTSLAGLILVLMWIIPYIYELFQTIQQLFALCRHAGFIYEICPAGIQFDDQYKCRYFYFWFCTDLSSENYRKYSDSGRISGSQPGLYKNSSADHRHCLYL